MKAVFEGFRLVASSALVFVAGRPATLCWQRGHRPCSPALKSTSPPKSSECRGTVGAAVRRAFTKLLPSDESKEMFVFGAIWINAAKSKYGASGQTVIASKMLYASDYFWTALEQRVLQSDRDGDQHSGS